MRCITIQHDSVLEQLNNKGIFYPEDNYIPENLVKPYDFMQKTYGFKHTPIFLNPVGLPANFYGARFDKDRVAIELEIPDNLCKIQQYYEWTDFIYFLEQRGEFRDTFDTKVFPTVESYGTYMLTHVKDLKSPEEDVFYQVVVEELRKEYIINTIKKLDKIEECHNGNGTEKILQSLENYL